MFAPDIKIVPGMAMVLFSSLTCVGPREAPEPADGGGVHAGTGEARDALCLGQMITNVIVLPETYHWEDPAHVLSVAEGFGPRTLDIAVSASVQPTVSVTGTATGTVTPAGAQPAVGTTAIPGLPPIFGIPGLPPFFGAPGTDPGSGTPGTPGASFFPSAPGAPGSRAPTDCQPPWSMSDCTPSNGQPWWSGPSNGQPSNGAPSSGALLGRAPFLGPGSCGLSLSDISAALGFSVSESITLQASSTYFVPTAAYARISAYPVFQKITWDIVSTGGWGWGAGPAGGVLGSGVVLKPIGVYFATYRAYDFALMGGGVVSPGPILDPAGTGGGSGTGGDAGAGGTGGAGGAGGAGGEAGAGGGGGGPGAGGSQGTGNQGTGNQASGGAGASGGGWWIPGGTGGAGGSGGP
ncbi:hypothetical protein [Sorangium sp. So ce513]|uniref:hypothetical protein n=1 Tax=Sorangium sp. So ce513 TaxID=3133315 RepID=UPI003F5D81C8